MTKDDPGYGKCRRCHNWMDRFWWTEDDQVCFKCKGLEGKWR